MSSEPAEHSDCGLMNAGGISHVNAALQVLFHVPELVSFLYNDEQHTFECRSMLCLQCGLLKCLKQLQRKECIAPEFFVNWWKRKCNGVPECKRNNPHEVLFLLITGLHGELTARGRRSQLLAPPITDRLFRGLQHAMVRCPSCGDQSHDQEFFSVEVNREHAGIKSLASIIHSRLMEERGMYVCHACSDDTVVWKPNYVAFPPYFIVSVTGFAVRIAEVFNIEIEGEQFQLLSCMTQVSGSPVTSYIGFCPDGVVRHIQDPQVKQMSIGSLLLLHIKQELTATFIFKKKKLIISNTEKKNCTDNVTPSSLELAKRTINKQKTHTQKQVPIFPSAAGLNELQEQYGPCRSRTASSQTDPIQNPCTSVGIQNDLLDYEKLSASDCNFEFWCGICVLDFEALYNLIGGDDVVLRLKQKYREATPEKARTKHTRFNGRNRLLMFLIRLKQGLTLEQLGFAFKMSDAYAGELCFVMTGLLYRTFQELSKHMFVTAAEQRRKKPKVMRPFKNLRVILDGASFYIDTPSNFEMQGNTYSQYKHHNVVLIIVGVSCQAATIFCSEAMEGSMSDKVATMKSNLSNLLEEGDAVMTDRGFELTHEMEKVGCTILKPPKKKKNRHFTKEEDNLTKAIAAARIYVEHAIADIKDNALLRGTIPLTLYPVVSQLIYIAAFMRNFRTPRIRNASMAAAKASDTPVNQLENLLDEVRIDEERNTKS